MFNFEYRSNILKFAYNVTNEYFEVHTSDDINVK